MPKSEPRIVDKDIGYRILIDTLHHSDLLPTFEQAHAGTPRESSRWFPNDPDVKNRETRKIRTLDDLLFLMQSGDHRRIAESVVLMGSNAPISWKQFFIRESQKEGMERFTDLYNRVGKIKGGDPIPCAMLFEASEDKILGVLRYTKPKDGKPGKPYRDVWVKGQGINVEGKNIDFELQATYLKDGHRTNRIINKGDLILVTGMAERSRATQWGETVRIYVDNEDAMRRITREELTRLPPPPEPVQPRALTVEEMGRLD